MKPISYYVETELLQDEVALEALKRGLLNMSQYAKQVQASVADRRMESVSLGSIITSLSRIADKYKGSGRQIPPVVFDQISIFGNLSETTYRVHEIPDSLLQKIFSTQEQSEDFFELTVGKNEITFITSNRLATQIQDLASTIEPIVILPQLIGITFRFSEDYFDQSGILYSILRVFALEQISVVEFVSTYRESTVILSENDLERGLEMIRRFFGMHTGVSLDK